jgi:sulfatase modifying factor 1
MPDLQRFSLPEIESRVCDLTAEQLGLRRSELHPGLRLIQDLHCDSLDAVELLMGVEDAFEIALPDDPRLIPFTQLGGRVTPDAYGSGPLLDGLGSSSQDIALYRRRTDGMVCVLVPPAEVVLGSDAADAPSDERPAHRVRLDAFLIDQEPVSATAYCRFLNSIGPVDADVLETWFVPVPNDKRRRHMLLQHTDDAWVPLPGTERMPMMLVSWHGANAYSLWANRRDWRAFDGNADGETYLPSEAQWEYAARGTEPREYPWGDDPTPERMRYAQHKPGATYRPETLPMAEVNAELGMSPFGLHHMAGNVWQWCRDWYSPSFYATPEASARNPVNTQVSHVRSERGGSWIGPAFLCRSSYRRGRVPSAKGRCLGFRCVSSAPDRVG